MVVAHRGASVEQPENTIAAFEAAIDAGADVV
ncbi:MAG TPA: glycerophosphodiester phosphodiesterase family protein, partial [Actinomycetota bacterium]